MDFEVFWRVDNGKYQVITLWWQFNDPFSYVASIFHSCNAFPMTQQFTSKITPRE